MNAKGFSFSVRRVPARPRNGRTAAAASAPAAQGVAVTPGQAVSGSGHTHENKADLDRIGTDGRYITLAEIEAGPDGEAVVAHPRAYAGHADTADDATRAQTAREAAHATKADTAARADTAALAEALATPGAEAGQLGAGALAMLTAAGMGRIETDELLVRNKAIFESLEIGKIDATAGTLIIGPACSTLTGAEPLRADGTAAAEGEAPAAWRCKYLADDGTAATLNTWRTGDQARCQTFNLASDASGAAASNRFYWRRVVRTGQGFIDLSAADAADGSDTPAAGDRVVCMGNRTDAGRQGFIALQGQGDGAPSLKLYVGVNAFSLTGKSRTSISPTGDNVFYGNSFNIITGSGDTVRIPADRGKWTAGTPYTYYDRVSHEGGLWLCIASPGQTTQEEPSETAIYWQLQVSPGTGAPGKDGEPGPQGPQGPQGPPGEDGTDGTDGKDGQDGSQGPQGPQGPAGQDGADGKDGADGQDGWTFSVQPAALRFSTSDGVSLSPAEGTATLRVWRGGKELAPSRITVTALAGDGCSLRSTGGAGVALTPSEVTGTAGGQTYRTAAAAGAARISFRATDTDGAALTATASVSFTVDTALRLGKLEYDNTRFSSELAAVDAAQGTLTTKVSAIEQTAESIRLEVDRNTARLDAGADARNLIPRSWPNLLAVSTLWSRRIRLEAGQYALSAEARVIGGGTFTLGLRLSGSSTETAALRFDSAEPRTLSAVVNVGTAGEYVLTASSDGTGRNYYRLRRVWLEKGAVATAWSESPSDPEPQNIFPAYASLCATGTTDGPDGTPGDYPHAQGSGVAMVASGDVRAALTAGETVTLSFRAKGSGVLNVYLYGLVDGSATCTGALPVEAGDTGYRLAADGLYQLYVSGGWKLYAVTFSVLPSLDSAKRSVLISTSGAADIYVADWRLDRDGRPRSGASPADLRATGIDIRHRLITVTADNLAVRNNAGEMTMAVDADGTLRAGALETAASGTGIRTRIAGGLIEIFGRQAKNIEFGVDDDGRAVMRYYSDDGRILWDLAATGLDVRDVAKSQWNSVTGFPLPSGFSWLANGTALDGQARAQLLAAVSGSSVTLWRYSAGRNGLNVLADSSAGFTSAGAAAADGKHFASKRAGNEFSGRLIKKGEADLYEYTGGKDEYGAAAQGRRVEVWIATEYTAGALTRTATWKYYK